MTNQLQIKHPAIGTHADQRVLHAGLPLSSAAPTVILLHGRGADAVDILDLSEHLDQTRFTFLAPQANDNTWYPYSFLSPLERNEPQLSSAISVVQSLIESSEARGVDANRIIIAGFSQGACLALETAARMGKRFAAVLAFSGGLIGPTIDITRYSSHIAGTPIMIGCDRHDPHIPANRVVESEQILTALGAIVTVRLYDDLGHSINRDELTLARKLLSNIV